MDKRATRFPDRTLGRSWFRWDGDVEGHEGDLDEGPGLYLAILAATLTFVTILLGVVAWLLIAPAGSSHPDTAPAVLALLAIPVLLGWGGWAICLLAVRAGLPGLSFALLSRWLTLQVRMMSFFARPFGISRDRVASSCIAITNALARLRLRADSTRRPLILLPRCLTDDCVREVKSVADEWDCPVIQVGTNRRARKHVREFGPSAVIAVACERDLVGGLYNFGHQLPILVIANRRPNGPCLQANIDIDRLRQALETLHAAAGPPAAHPQAQSPAPNQAEEAATPRS